MAAQWGGGLKGVMDPENLDKAPETPIMGPQNHNLAPNICPWRPLCNF